jgi:sugar lactone lactonase YvrE
LAILAPLPLSAGTIDTIAGTGEKSVNGQSGAADKVNIGQPFGMEVGPDGKVYVTEVENHRIFRIDLEQGRVEAVAGSGKKGSSGDGGAATEAALNEPYELRFASDGDIVFVEMVGAVIRRVDRNTGIMTRVAGTGEVGFGGDGGPALEAKFDKPHSIALDATGAIYVADIGNHRVRRIDPTTGLITTIIGTGEAKMPKAGDLAAGQPIRGPRALCVIGDQLYIALREGHSVWRLDLPSGRIFHVAGDGKAGNVDGPAAKARFNGPKGLAAGPENDLYVMDTENQTARRIDLATGEVTTVAGSGPQGRGFGGDGGSAVEAKMDRPHGIAVDSRGVIYIGDSNNHRVRRVRP